MLLTLENNETRWKHLWKNRLTKDPEVTNKWTNSGKSMKDGKTNKLRGWSEEGIMRFNELIDLVRKNRDDYRLFEADLLSKWQGAEKNRESKRRRTTGREETSIVAAVTDFPWQNVAINRSVAQRASAPAVNQGVSEADRTYMFLCDDLEDDEPVQQMEAM